MLRLMRTGQGSLSRPKRFQSNPSLGSWACKRSRQMMANKRGVIHVRVAHTSGGVCSTAFLGQALSGPQGQGCSRRPYNRAQTAQAGPLHLGESLLSSPICLLALQHTGSLFLNSISLSIIQKPQVIML